MVKVTIPPHLAGEAFLRGHYTTSFERSALVGEAIRELSGVLRIAHKVSVSEARLILKRYQESLRAQEAIMLLAAFPLTPGFKKIRTALLAIVLRAPVKHWMDIEQQIEHPHKRHLFEWWPIHALKSADEISVLVDKVLSNKDTKRARDYAGILQTRTRRVFDEKEVMTELWESWLPKSQLEAVVSFLAQK